MDKLINDLKLALGLQYQSNDILDQLGLDYDEDLICILKDNFINIYKDQLSPEQIDYIFYI
jgi:hypothetical protein